MKAARVFASSSTREGFGITCVEADTIDRSHGERTRRFDDLLARLEEAV
jgi:hypothetical protein